MSEAIIQGLIQGLTEFLPVSSSGHLVLAQSLFGFQDLDPSYNVVVQGGTVFSVLFFYGKRIIVLTQKYFLPLILASIPAALIGLYLAPYTDTLFSSLTGASLGFFLTTILLFASKYAPLGAPPVSGRQALFIGFAQALALLPGLSRSGTTIVAALYSKISPREAFDFSFLLSVPIVGGAALLGATQITWESQLIPSYFLGLSVAAIAGYFALKFLTRVVAEGKLYFFAPYTALLAVLTFYLSL